ncbi:MAG TPA: carbohydrate ABC transporter permease, partial [Candidatus Paenibacillus intestinavium]|nr:carbohydrate ABC transporter permease [Candidatus Paenibacillus intestinavium]
MVKKNKLTLFDGLNTLIILILVLACLLPFLHILSVSLSSNGPIMSGKVTFYPIDISFEAYSRVFTDILMLKSLWFTIVLTLGFTLLAMIMTTMAAYTLSINNLKGKKLFMFIIVFTMFFSGGLIPEYLLMKDLNLLDSLWVLILPGLISPFNMIIMISFFKSTIPDSLIEAAEIDGCSDFGKLFRIVLPLSTPVLATLSLFYAVGRWNGFRDALFYISNQELYPMQLKLYQMVMNNMVSEVTLAEGANAGVQLLPESLKAASIMFATIPILLVYPWLQRYFVS